MKRTLTHLLTGLLLLSNTATYAEDLAQKLDELIQATLPDATVGVLIQNLDGSPVYAHHAETLLCPASNTKLYTAAAALYGLGLNYRYETVLSQQGPDRYVIFSGAPDLKSEDVHAMLQHLGPIEGNLIIDASRFPTPFYLPGISYDDIGWYFAAPSSAVILNENKEDYAVTFPKTNGQLVVLASQQEHPILSLVNDIRAVDPETAAEHCTLDVEVQPHNTLHLTGCLAREQYPTTLSFAVTDPFQMAKQVLHQGLEKYHVRLMGDIISDKAPDTATVLIRHLSAPLSQLVDEMMQNSNNLYADSLTKTMGYQLTHEGSTTQGMYAMKSILSQKANMDMTYIQLKDGSGTRYDMSSASHIVTLLRHVYQDPDIRAPFLHSLPIMGVSGSLISRMKGTDLEKRVFAKTGTMHDISALSGYMHTAQGETLVFSILINGVTQIQQAKMLEEKILALVYSQMR